ncbi:hypothetical protein QAD02_018304 [Eretmocerus hayati]|uniref:Uncharacterized protein n=3 Tax=Eretmocerus hayati TaxID=131215 RepID=A0ACC2PJE1_9HYME|nr:hypothetical protein QAD02_018304 [Eretmocerus hayati]
MSLDQELQYLETTCANLDRDLDEGCARIGITREELRKQAEEMMLPGTSEVTPGTTAPATVPPPTQDIAPASSVTPDSSAPAIMAESPALTRRYNREKVVTPAARLPKAELSTKVKRTTRSTFAVDLQKLRGRKPTPARSVKFLEITEQPGWAKKMEELRRQSGRRTAAVKNVAQPSSAGRERPVHWRTGGKGHEKCLEIRHRTTNATAPPAHAVPAKPSLPAYKPVQPIAAQSPPALPLVPACMLVITTPVMRMDTAPTSQQKTSPPPTQQNTRSTPEDDPDASRTSWGS